MKKSNEISIGDAIREMLKQYNLEEKYEEVRISGLWPEIVGEMISQHTEHVYIKYGKIYVKLDSPALKNELTYMRSRIVDSINEKAGKEIVTDVVFV